MNNADQIIYKGMIISKANDEFLAMPSEISVNGRYFKTIKGAKKYLDKFEK